MSLAFTLTRAGVRAVSAIAPQAGARLTVSLFLVTRPRMKLRPVDAEIHRAARRAELAVHNGTAIVYAWGSGRRTALLVPGWRGRSTQFRALIETLLEQDFTVYAFDAPAHGDAPGKKADVRDWLGVIEHLFAENGPFDVVVGHSFGVFAELTAARDTDISDRIVAIAGAGSAWAFLEEFAAILGLSKAQTERFGAAFAARLGEDPAEARDRYDTVAHPLRGHVRLLVIHDTEDPQLPPTHSQALAEAHGDRASYIETSGLGHSKILGAQVTRDAILEFTTLAPQASVERRRAKS